MSGARYIRAMVKTMDRKAAPISRDGPFCQAIS
jgi:hypothetical protein